jgi:hypothetical protein
VLRQVVGVRTSADPRRCGFRWNSGRRGCSGYPPGFLAGAHQPNSGGYASCTADDGNGDDFIGCARLDFAAWELEAALPNVGDEAHRNRRAEPFTAAAMWHWLGPWTSAITTHFRITRLRDVRVDRSLLVTMRERHAPNSRPSPPVCGLARAEPAQDRAGTADLPQALSVAPPRELSDTNSV